MTVKVNAVELLTKVPTEFSAMFVEVAKTSDEMWLEGIPSEFLLSKEFNSFISHMDELGETKGKMFMAALVTLVTAAKHL